LRWFGQDQLLQIVRTRTSAPHLPIDPLLTDLGNSLCHTPPYSNIANWQSAGKSDYRDRGAAAQCAFIEKMFSWVDGALDGGGSVLVHCLAGAHRAGTTGILLLMHKTGVGAEQATAAAKAARPIIDPIFDFVDCLSMYERNRQPAGRSPSA
jgi:protein tyrosine phosphatase